MQVASDCRAELQGRGGKKGLRACQPPAAPASGTLKHLRTTSDKLLNASGLQSSHLQSESQTWVWSGALAVGRLQNLGLFQIKCQRASGLSAQGRPPRHREPRVGGWKERKVITLPNWATQRILVPPKCLKTDSSCRAGHLCRPPAQFLSWSGLWWSIVNQQWAGNNSPGGLLSRMDETDPQSSIFLLGGPQEARAP